MTSTGSPLRRTGVLLAAGRGRRMGQTKQLLPWPPNGSATVIESSFDSIAPWCAHMFVVLDHDRSRIVRALEPRAFEVIESDADADLMESMRRGLSQAHTVNPDGIILLQLGDHPDANHETVQAVVQHSEQHRARAIIPERAGKGGHPVAIPSSLIPMILDWNGDGGLRQFWIDHPEWCERIPFEGDAGITFDLDTPDDYRQ